MHSHETPASLGSAPRLSRGAKGLIAALSAVVTLATGVVSLRAQLLPAHPSSTTTSGLQSESHKADAGVASASAAASATGRPASSTQRGATSSPPARLSSAGGTACGGGLHAGPHTSCPFAQNVRAAYNAAPGATASVRVFSPVTGQTYTMSCAAAGRGVTCSGANNASATWGG